MLYHGLTGATEDVAGVIVNIVKAIQEASTPTPLDNTNTILSTRRRGAVMDRRYTELETYYACKEDPTQLGYLFCLICSAEKGYLYSFKGGPAAGKKHFARCHKNIATVYSMADEESRRKRVLTLKCFVDKANQMNRYVRPSIRASDPVGNCLCDAILSHGVSYSQGPVLKQLLTKVISAIAKHEGYTSEIQNKMMDIVSMARVSRSTIQRRGAKQYALHKEMVQRLVKEADGYSILIGTILSGEVLRLFVAMNCLWVRDGFIQTVLCGLPALSVPVTVDNILNTLFQSIGMDNPLINSMQQHNTFLQKLTWISVCEDSTLRNREIKLEKMMCGLECNTLPPVSKITSITQVSFLQDILNMHSCDTLIVVTAIIEQLASMLIDSKYLDIAEKSYHTITLSDSDTKNECVRDRIDHLLTKFYEAENQLDCFSLTDLKEVLEFILNNRDNLTRLILDDREPTVLLYQCISNIFNRQWFQKSCFIEELLTLLCPLDAMFDAPNACVLEVYTYLDELRSTLCEAYDLLPHATSNLLLGGQKHTRELPGEYKASDDTEFYLKMLSAYINEIDTTLDCYSPYISCFKLCTFKISNVTRNEITNLLNSVPCKIGSLEEIADEYYFVYKSQEKIDGFIPLQHKNIHECWREYVSFWSNLQASYPLVSRYMLTLLTIFGTPAIFRTSKNLLNNTLSAQRSCLTETNTEAALLLRLNSQLHNVSKSIYFEFILTTSIGSASFEDGS